MTKKQKIKKKTLKLRSKLWFDNENNPGMTALYIERYLNHQFTKKELQSDKPIIGIAQTGSDLSPCNKIHSYLSDRIKDGIRSNGGIPLEFPVHPIQETGKRPTAALDRNLSYLSLVEILHGYPIDGVVLTTGCDKTTPALLMGACTVDIPSIVLSSGPMLDGWWKGKRVGSGTVIWESRRLLSDGKINNEEFKKRVCASAPSLGHCNTMGTALTMNCLAEVLGMSLPGNASIPAPYRERREMAFLTGERIVDMVREDLKPSDILSKEAFINSIIANSALGGSTNAPPHIQAIARHIGLEMNVKDWETYGYEIPLLVNLKPAGKYLGESFFRAGGVPAMINELEKLKHFDINQITATGKTHKQNNKDIFSKNKKVISSIKKPFKKNAGFLVLSGNLFESSLLKTSVLSENFNQMFFNKNKEGVFNAVVFEGPENYHEMINSNDYNIDKNSILIIRGVGCIGYPGSAEVVNMSPPDNLIKKGINHLPTLGDGRQSGTSESPSILNASPEAFVGGGLAYVKTGDTITIDLEKRKVMLIIDNTELEKRKKKWKPPYYENQTPWQEIYRNTVGQLDKGGCIELATKYQKIRKKIPRNSH